MILSWFPFVALFNKTLKSLAPQYFQIGDISLEAGKHRIFRFVGLIFVFSLQWYESMAKTDSRPDTQPTITGQCHTGAHSGQQVQCMRTNDAHH